MIMNAEITWLTLLGLSFLFVGGFVLWVYSGEAPRRASLVSGPEAKAAQKLQGGFAQWFLLYGGATCFAGVGCLLTAAMLVL
jgi:hypothetical protein